jgi:hypothetical protein
MAFFKQGGLSFLFDKHIWTVFFEVLLVGHQVIIAC